MMIAIAAAAALLILALFALLVRKQVRRHEFKLRKFLALPAIMLLVGLFADPKLGERLDSAAAWAFLAGGLVLAAVTAYFRAGTMSIERTERGVFAWGDRRTVAWWIASLAIRIAVLVGAGFAGVTEGFGEAMLFAGVTFGVQSLLLARRAGLLGARSAVTAR